MRAFKVILLAAALPLLAGCGSSSSLSNLWQSAPAQPAVLPSSIAAEQLIGNWGLAAYHQDAARARTEKMARTQCRQPYQIARGQSGGVMMHLADSEELYELHLKGGPGGANFIGPEGPINNDYDREIESFDGSVMIMRWLDPDPASRYGKLIYVKCA